jgi:serine/threonine-protein kinase
MAPEQVAADPAASFPVDLYALGVVAYEMLTGGPPFADRPPQQVMAAHIAEVPVPLPVRRTDVPPGLAALVMQCLEKDPAARPASAAALVTALDDPQVVSGSFLPIAGNASEVARQLTDGHPAPRARATPPWRGARALLVAAGAGVLALFGWILSGRDRTVATATGAAGRASAAAPAEALPRSVSVLPFAYVGADTAQAYVARAITEAITSGLSQEPGLRVQ